MSGDAHLSLVDELPGATAIPAERKAFASGRVRRPRKLSRFIE